MSIMEIIFLGTSQATPTEKRNHPSIWLSYNNENILIDCGEGTQRQIRIAKLNPCALTRILITHWHGDHVLGIPGLLQTLELNGYNKVLHIYGPAGTKKKMNIIMSIFNFIKKGLKFEVHEVSSKVFEEKNFKIIAKKMSHPGGCLAYAFIEKDKLKLDKEKLKKLNIPSSPLLSKLKEGKDVVINGKKILVRDVAYKVKGRKIGFITDTAINKNVISIAKDSDILVCEATFSKKAEDKARKYKHLTSENAAQIAKKSGAKKLILTHLSQRYEKNPELILEEAKETFKETILAEDFMRIKL